MRLPTGRSLANSTSCLSPVRYGTRSLRGDSDFDNRVVNEQDIAGEWQIIASKPDLLCVAHVQQMPAVELSQTALSLPEHCAAKVHARQYSADTFGDARVHD